MQINCDDEMPQKLKGFITNWYFETKCHKIKCVCLHSTSHVQGCPLSPAIEEAQSAGQLPGHQPALASIKTMRLISNK